MRQEAGQGMNFLEAIFSFVFGDGNPNESYDDRRWRLVSAAVYMLSCLLGHVSVVTGFWQASIFQQNC